MSDNILDNMIDALISEIEAVKRHSEVTSIERFGGSTAGLRRKASSMRFG